MSMKGETITKENPTSGEGHPWETQAAQQNWMATWLMASRI